MRAYKLLPDNKQRSAEDIASAAHIAIGARKRDLQNRMNLAISTIKNRYGW